MLVATPGQTASYSLHGSVTVSATAAAGAKKICRTSSVTPKNSTNNLISHKTSRSIINKLPCEPALSSTTASSTVTASSKSNANTNVASALMKTLSVRLNRGTDFLKGTVQKALISTNNTTTATAAAASTNATATATGNSTANTININNTNTTTKTTSSATSTSLSSSCPSSAKSKVILPSSSFLKLYTVPPTKLHRYAEERLCNDSVDSLHKEMCHFKPIRSVPTTPWKCNSKSRGASLRMPKACVATKVNLNLSCDDSLITSGTATLNKAREAAALLVSANASAHSSDDDEAEDNVIAYKHFKPKPSSTLLTTIISTPSHQSAFVCLVAQMNTVLKTQSKMPAKTIEPNRPKSGRLKAKPSNILPSSALQNSLAQEPANQVSLRTRKNPIVQIKNINLPIRNVQNKTTAANRTKKTTASVAKAKVVNSKTKSKSMLAKSKTKQLNLVALAQENNNNVGRHVSTTSTKSTVKAPAQHGRIRKRQTTNDLNNEATSDETTAGRVKRKSGRLSKDCSRDVLKFSAAKNISFLNKGQQPPTAAQQRQRGRGREVISVNNNTERAGENFSPPLTRSRLRQLSTQAQQKVTSAYQRRGVI